MATLKITTSDVSLQSSWNYSTSSQGVHYSNITTAYDSRTFDLKGIPAGSTIQSAQLSCSRWGSGAVRTMDGRDADSFAVAVSRITPQGALQINFAYRATPYYPSGGGSTGTASSRAGWYNITLTVTYQEPYSSPTAPTSVILSKATASPGEEITLSWSGAKAGTNVPISRYEVHRAQNPAGPYSLLQTVAANVTSIPVTAPETPGSFSYKVRALGSGSYNSGLSSAYATVALTVTAPTAPANLALSPARQYPDGEAVLTWDESAPGEDNPVTGYAVYVSDAPAGAYALLLTAEGTSCTVTAPQSGALYFKAAAVGRFLNSELSGDAAVLTADLSGTSGFSLAPGTVDAGQILTVTLDGNLDKAHTLTVAIGEYSETIQAAAGTETIPFTPPMEWLRAIPDSETGEMTVTLTTQGAGTIRRSALLRCPDDVIPTVTGAAAEPVSDEIPAAWQVYVAGKSKARITLNTAASAPYGAQITAYRIAGAGADVEADAVPVTALTDTLTLAGEQVIEVIAIDSRGRSGKQPITLTVHPYAPPGLSDLMTVRCTPEGEEADEGVHALATATVLYSSCGGNNAVSCLISYRKQGADTWLTGGALQDGRKIFGGDLTLPDNWDIRYTVTDSLNHTTVYYDTVTRAVWEIHVKRGGGAWAFGGVADVDGALHVYGSVVANNVGSVLLWENPAPTSDFAAQTVTLSQSAENFDYLLVLVASNKNMSSGYYIYTQIHTSGMSLLSCFLLNQDVSNNVQETGYQQMFSQRQATVNGTRIAFTGNVYWRPSYRNWGSTEPRYKYVGVTDRQDICIPLKIYGMKL